MTEQELVIKWSLYNIVQNIAILHGKDDFKEDIG